MIFLKNRDKEMKVGIGMISRGEVADRCRHRSIFGCAYQRHIHYSNYYGGTYYHYHTDMAQGGISKRANRAE